VDGLESVLLLADEWELELGPRLENTNEAIVHLTDDAVLRVDLYDNATFEQRVAVLQAADGCGYARLLRHDVGRRAMLLELLEPFAATFEDVQRALADAWRVETDYPFRTAADKARDLAQFIEEYWQHFERPTPRAKVDHALELCESRAAAWDPADAVVVHGDAHAHNVLRRANGELAFIDPEPFRCERAYDIAVALRMGGDAQDQPRAVQEWHFIERLSTGLQCLRLGYHELARDLFDDS
jgi:streptomycin 6-kinase